MWPIGEKNCQKSVIEHQNANHVSEKVKCCYITLYYLCQILLDFYCKMIFVYKIYYKTSIHIYIVVYIFIFSMIVPQWKTILFVGRDP